MNEQHALKQYFPALVMVLAAVLSVFATALTDNRVTAAELINIGLVSLAAVTTYIVPRLTTVTWVKPAVAFVYAALNALLSFLTDGISASEWVLVVLAALGAIGVTATNKFVPMTPVTRTVNPPDNA